MPEIEIMKLFVYGTLMKDFRNYYRYLQGHVANFQNARTNGEMYHLKHKNCPAVICGNNTIYGEVVTFNDDNELTLLKRLDLMEEYFEGSPEPMYKRKEITIRYDDNSEDKVFAYIFINKDFLNKDNSEYIEYGDWARYIKETSL